LRFYAEAFGFKVASDIKMNKKQIVSFNGELTIKNGFCPIGYTVKNIINFTEH